MPADVHIIETAHVIQLAVAPVFLLSGVGIILTVLTNRLSRIVDRARILEQRLSPDPVPDKTTTLHSELHFLSRRARLIYWAITLSTISGLLVCLVIVTLFVGHFLRLDLSGTIVMLFITAMLAFVGAFVCFLREIYLGTTSLRFGPPS